MTPNGFLALQTASARGGVAVMLLAAVTGAASAQQPEPQAVLPIGLIGPSFEAGSVNSQAFDVVFEKTVSAWPTWELARNQTAEARFDAVVCNLDTAKRGAVRPDAGSWGYLDPGLCTFFANFAQLDFWRPDGESDWNARIFLRAKR